MLVGVLGFTYSMAATPLHKREMELCNYSRDAGFELKIDEEVIGVMPRDACKTFYVSLALGEHQMKVTMKDSFVKKSEVIVKLYSGMKNPIYFVKTNTLPDEFHYVLNGDERMVGLGLQIAYLNVQKEKRESITVPFVVSNQHPGIK